MPLEQELGWSRATVALAVAVNLTLYGLAGPFAAAMALRVGRTAPRRDAGIAVAGPARARLSGGA